MFQRSSACVLRTPKSDGLAAAPDAVRNEDGAVFGRSGSITDRPRDRMAHQDRRNRKADRQRSRAPLRASSPPCCDHDLLGFRPIAANTVHWEGNDRDEAQAIIAGLDLADVAPAAVARAALRAMHRTGPVRATLSCVENQVHACGRANFTRAEIEGTIVRQVSLATAASWRCVSPADRSGCFSPESSPATHGQLPT